MRYVLAVLAFVAATGASFLWWQNLGRPLDLPPVPGGRLDCLSYTPYDGGASPHDDPYIVPDAQIREDLVRLKPYTDCLRVYSSTEAPGQVAPIAHELGIELLQGLWISGETERDAEEIAAGLRIAEAYPDTVRALVVGNEVLLRRELLGRQLAALIRKVKSETSEPVTYADIYEFWRRNPEVAEAVDFITMHVLPHWDDPEPVPIGAVQEHVRGIVERARSTFPGRDIIIGEIGWPSAGRTRGGAVPSLVNQARFIRDFTHTARELGIAYNIIEAVDQPWKRWPEGTVGGYWGILDTGLELKFPLSGPVSEWPRWPLAFLVGSGMALLVMAAAWPHRRRLGAARWLGVALLGQGLGTVLVMAFEFVATTSITWAGWLVGLAGMGLSAAAAASLMPLLVGSGRAWATSRPAPVADVLAALRGPWRQLILRPPLALAAMHGIAAFAACIQSVDLAFDPRHRDFPITLFLLPAVAVVIRWLWLGRGEWRPGTAEGREEAWLAFILLSTAPFTLDGWLNTEAMIWAAVASALALPWVAPLGRELARLGRAAAVPREAH